MITPFDPLKAIRKLNQHGVRFVLIGGLGARLRGSPTVTSDMDICYDRDPTNLEALARALKDLKATLRGADEDLPFLLDARTLAAGDHFTFTTTAGPIDILGTPAGTDGFGGLTQNATSFDVGGETVLVASLDDLIEMKRAAGRPKDLVEMEILGAIKDTERERA